METTPTKSNTDTAIAVIGAIFGTAHLIFQTAADITAHTEGKLVEKVSKGAITKSQCIENRKNSTLIKQQKMREAISNMRNKTKTITAQEEPQPITNES